ncbi:hypothetical protein [Cronobacter phage vB_Cdu_VP8]|nr:hypothetical protein [Cronobacter phage vB_Cdu_VP8]
MEKIIVDAWYKVHPKMKEDGEINRMISVKVLEKGGMFRVIKLADGFNETDPAVGTILLQDGTVLDSDDFETDLSCIFTNADLNDGNIIYSHMHDFDRPSNQNEIVNLENQILVLTELLAEKQNLLIKMKAGEIQ